MGATLSDNERDFGDALTLQQQRAQFRTLQQQLQDARNAGALGAVQGEAIRPLALALAGGAQAIRPVEQPSLRMSRVFKNPAHVHSKTLGLGKKGQQPAVPSVSFRFDATQPGTIRVYWNATCSVDANGGLLVRFAEWLQSSTFEAGMGQECTVDWSSAAVFKETEKSQAAARAMEDLGDWASSLCCWPLLVELRVDAVPEGGQQGEQVTSIEWTMVRVLDVPGLPESAAEVVGQKVACGDAPVLDLREVFGSEVAADGTGRQDCIVCQSEPRDTMVLPCRHMCLCSICAEYIRTRVQYHSYKCPICRKKISQMMRVDESSTAGISWADSDAAIDIGVSSSDSEPDV